MERSLFAYIWRFSRPEQVVILALVVLAQIFYFLSLTVPKDVINNGIQGNAFKNQHTIPFLVWEFDLSAFLPGKVIRLFDGFQVDQLQYLVAMSFVFLGAVVVNGLITDIRRADAAIRAAAEALALRAPVALPVLHLSGNRLVSEASACREHGGLFHWRRPASYRS